MNKDKALALVLDAAQQKHDEGGIELQVSPNTPLIGSESGLDSMALVELCLELEDKASELNFDFDWTSDAALSKSKGIYRSVDALAEEFFSQYENQK